MPANEGYSLMCGKVSCLSKASPNKPKFWECWEMGEELLLSKECRAGEREKLFFDPGPWPGRCVPASWIFCRKIGDGSTPQYRLTRVLWVSLVL